MHKVVWALMPMVVLGLMSCGERSEDRSGGAEGESEGQGGGGAGSRCSTDADCDPAFRCEDDICVARGPQPDLGEEEGQGQEGEGEGAVTEGEGEGLVEEEGADSEGKGDEGEGEGAAPLCLPDAFSPNGTPATAKALPGNDVENLSLCENEEDWFRLPLERGQSVVVTVNGRGLQVELRAPDGLGVVAQSNPFAGGAQAARSPVPGDGSYLIRVYGRIVVNYSLQVEVTGGGEGEGEGEDPEGYGCKQIYDCAGSCRDQACLDRCVSLAAPASQQLWDTMYGCWGQHCADVANDSQAFSACVQQNCMAQTNNCMQDDHAVEGEGEGWEGEGEGGEVGTLGCNDILNCAQGCQDNACMSNCMEQGTPNGQGLFQAMLQCIQTNCGNVQDENEMSACMQQFCMNEVSACMSDTGGGGPCVDDRYGPNNRTPQSASPIEPGSYELVRCPNSEDWYSITVPAGKTLSLELISGDMWRDFSLYLTTADGQPVAESATWWQADEFLTYSTLGRDEELRIMVTIDDPIGLATTETKYSLTITIDDGGGMEGEVEPCVDDQLEPNDDEQTASPIRMNIPINGVICNNNRDWFRFVLDNQGNIFVQMMPGFDTGDLDLDLLDADLNRLERSDYGLGETEEITLDGLTAGEYFLVVFGANRLDTGDYTLQISNN